MRTKTNDTGYNAAEHNDLCVGIDLGTTNSVLATINEKLNGDIVSKVVEHGQCSSINNSTQTAVCQVQPLAMKSSLRAGRLASSVSAPVCK